jgi:hypothetical protein
MSMKFGQIKNLLIERCERALGTSRHNSQQGCGDGPLAAWSVVVLTSGLDYLSAELINVFLEKLIAEDFLSGDQCNAGAVQRCSGAAHDSRCD